MDTTTVVITGPDGKKATMTVKSENGVIKSASTVLDEGVLPASVPAQLATLLQKKIED